MTLLKSVALALAGGCVIYLAVAACDSIDNDSGGGGVRDAEAAGVEAKTVTCDVSVENSSGITLVWAEASFPDKTMHQLASAVVVVPVSDSGRPAGYSHEVAGEATMVVRDGMVAYRCGNDESLGEEVTIIALE